MTPELIRHSDPVMRILRIYMESLAKSEDEFLYFAEVGNELYLRLLDIEFRSSDLAWEKYN